MIHEHEKHKVSRETLDKMLDTAYSDIMQELENMKPRTPYTNIEELYIESFKFCFNLILDQEFENILYEYHENKDLTVDDIENMVDKAIDTADRVCTEKTYEDLAEYIENLEDPREKDKLTQEFEKFIEYEIKHNLA